MSADSSASRHETPFAKHKKEVEGTRQTYNKVPISILFPDVDEAYINHLLRIHKNENQVINQLFCEACSCCIRSNQLDETLFYKLKSNFPTFDPEQIRLLIEKHNNQEHEVIAAIIANLGSSRFASYALGSPKMKLRYIKLLYPETDEAILFDLLYNCDQNAQTVIERLEKMGYERQYLFGPHKQPTEGRLGQTLSKKPSTLQLKQPHFPPNVVDKQYIFHRLQEDFPHADMTLINMALECAGFIESKARGFLNAMTPQDSEKYLPKARIDEEDNQMQCQTKGIQVKAFIEMINGTPIMVRKSTSGEKKMCNMGTWTAEDGVIIVCEKKPRAKGAEIENSKGPNVYNLLKSYIPWRGADASNHHGPNRDNQEGPKIGLIKSVKSEARGADPKNKQGPCFLFRKPPEPEPSLW